MRRGDIYLIDLHQQFGSEQSGLRPAIVVQNDVGNIYSPTTIICPITSKQKHRIKTHLEITPNDADVREISTVLCEQLRVVDKQRLKKKLGSIKNQNIMNDLNKKLLISIGVKEDE